MFYELGTVLRALQAKLTYPNSLMRDILLLSHFTDEDTEAQRELVTCLKSHSSYRKLTKPLDLDSVHITTVVKYLAQHLAYENMFNRYELELHWL